MCERIAVWKMHDVTNTPGLRYWCRAGAQYAAGHKFSLIGHQTLVLGQVPQRPKRWLRARRRLSYTVTLTVKTQEDSARSHFGQLHCRSHMPNNNTAGRVVGNSRRVVFSLVFRMP